MSWTLKNHSRRKIKEFYFFDFSNASNLVGQLILLSCFDLLYAIFIFRFTQPFYNQITVKSFTSFFALFFSPQSFCSFFLLFFLLSSFFFLLFFLLFLFLLFFSYSDYSFFQASSLESLTACLKESSFVSKSSTW